LPGGVSLSIYNAYASLYKRGWLEQLKAIAITIALVVVGTAVIGTLVKAVIGLRIALEVERQGLDINEHGEKGTSHREQSLLHKGRKGHNEKNYFQ